MNTLFIDVYPDEYISWDDWHSAVSYPLGSQNLPYVPDEARWKEFASEFISTPALDSYGLDGPEAYAPGDWRGWGRDILEAVNGVYSG